MTVRLALIRHGHTEWNRAHRIQGRTDIPLDQTAINDLAQMRLPAPWETARLVSSPLARAVRTGQLLTGRLPDQHAALTEMNWGEWEGLHGAQLRADPSSGFRDIEDWGWHWRPPGGESPAEMRARLEPWAAQLMQDTVAVCHIGIMRVLLAIAAGWEFSGPAPFSIKRNRLYLIEMDGDNWRAHCEPVRLVVR